MSGPVPNDLRLIAAADDRWGLGRQGGLLARISPDLRRFKELTLGHTVILGRKTLSTFPQGRPLAGRENIILSRDQSFQTPGARIAHSLEELWTMLAGLKAGEPVFVCGGAQIYAQLVPYCRLAHITRVRGDFQADCHLLPLDREAAWQLTQRGELQSWQGWYYSFDEYQRIGSQGSSNQLI